MGIVHPRALRLVPVVVADELHVPLHEDAPRGPTVHDPLAVDVARGDDAETRVHIEPRVVSDFLQPLEFGRAVGVGFLRWGGVGVFCRQVALDLRHKNREVAEREDEFGKLRALFWFQVRVAFECCHQLCNTRVHGAEHCALIAGCC